MLVLGRFLRCLDEFHQAMVNVGFADVTIRDISMRIAPSVLHVPRITFGFLGRQLLKGNLRMNRARWNNVIAPNLGILLGLARRRFGYYLITARKPK